MNSCRGQDQSQNPIDDISRCCSKSFDHNVNLSSFFFHYHSSLSVWWWHCTITAHLFYVGWVAALLQRFQNYIDLGVSKTVKSLMKTFKCSLKCTCICMGAYCTNAIGLSKDTSNSDRNYQTKLQSIMSPVEIEAYFAQPKKYRGRQKTQQNRKIGKGKKSLLPDFII